MSPKCALLGLVHFLTALALGSECPPDAIAKHVVCYYEGTTSLTDFHLCNCTHVVFTNAVRRSGTDAINLTEDAERYLRRVKEKKPGLSAVFSLSEEGEGISKVLKSGSRSAELVAGIRKLVEESEFDGVEVDFRFRSDDGVSKEALAAFVKSLSKSLSSGHRRTKRDGYDVFERLDDITTAAYTTQTPKNSTSKTQSITRTAPRKDSSRRVREQADDDPDDSDYLTLEDPPSPDAPNTLTDLHPPPQRPLLLLLRLPLQPEIIAKKYDLKAISRYADILIVPTHHITATSEDHLTYHPSRLMGLADILNTDSILDLLTGLGGLKSKMVISLPATVLKFQLQDDRKNTPRAPAAAGPERIDQSQLCALLGKGNWTVERDEDLTAPYAFSGKTWLAFEDDVSVSIKAKYILLRGLAGGAIYPIDADVSDGVCGNSTNAGGHLTAVLRSNFDRLERKPRGLVLERLQEEIHDTAFASAEAGVQLSEYRIVRVVDHTGAVHVVRRNTKTQFECSRQGYFSHPLGCNKFYRCVKFDQYSDDFTVFEYNCPAGLAFDERWEVCVWPGSLPHGAPCTGSSEIAPVPRAHFRCPPLPGYYPDPQNCRWFFACLDHARDGVTPLTAYEFRCPFGLVFSAEKLSCDWPWVVGSCGGGAGAGAGTGVVRAFVNGGDLGASAGVFGGLGGFGGFGRRVGGDGGYEGAQSAGLGYIAGGEGWGGREGREGRGGGAFGGLPEHEVSGGRVLAKGGVVLEGSVGGGVVGGGYGVGQQHAIVTPKPFSVSIPSVQVNSEFSGLSSAPESVLLTATSPRTESVSVHQQQFSTSQGFTLTPSAVAVTPSTPILSGSSHLLTPVSSTPKTETHRFSAPIVSVSVTPKTHEYSAPVASVSVTPKTHQFSAPVVSVTATPAAETHGFEQFGFRQNVLSAGAVGVSTAAQGLGYSGGSVTTPVSASLPVVTPKSAAVHFGSAAQTTAFHKPTESGFAQTHVIQHQTVGAGVGKSTLAVGTPAVGTHSIGAPDISAGAGLSFAPPLPTLTPPPLPAASPTVLTSSQQSLDQKVSNELYLNTPRFPTAAPKTELFSKTIGQANVLSSRAPTVTTRPDFRFTQTGYSATSSGKALHSFPAVASQPAFKLNEVTDEVTPVVPFAFSGLSTGKPSAYDGAYGSNGFEQTSSAGKVSSGAAGAAGEIPFGFAHSEVSPPAQQHSFGQRYSFQFSGSSTRTGSLPDGPAGPTVQQVPLQPVVSVTPVTLSTPRPFQSVSFQSSHQQQTSISTPSPVVSFSPSTSVTLQPPPHSLNVFAKSRTVQQQQPESVRVETSVPILQDVSFGEKSNVQQELKSFAPVSVTTTAYGQPFGVGSSSDFFAKSGAYSPSVADVELSGPTVQQLPTKLQFENAAEERGAVHQSFEFFGSRSTSGKVALTQANAVVPERATVEGPAVSTVSPFTPQEKLVGLEITKSVELTPSQFFHSGEYTSGRSIEIQQQPLHVISQKTFPPKAVIQPFYKQQQTEIGGNQFVLQQQVDVTLPPVTSKPFVSTYSTAKSVSIQTPVPVYSGEGDREVPVLPAFQAPKVPIQKGLPVGGYAPLAKHQQVFVEQQQTIPSPKPNLLLPTTTALPDFVSPQTNEIFIPNSVQKVSAPHQLDTSSHFFLGSNLTAGVSVGSEVKYAINPNIAIPEPPKEYVLSAFTTAAPEPPRGAQSATALRKGGAKSATYLPPASRRRPVASVGSSAEVDDNALVDRYSGRFGEVIGGRGGKGEVEGSSTVRYEVSSTTGRPSSRGRQYLGGITSGLPASSKYEEYEIEKEGQRSLQGSKAGLDLNNLKNEKKKAVIVVSQVSDANPILVGKLAGQCSCQSNMLQIRSKGKAGNSGRKPISNRYLPPLETNEAAGSFGPSEVSTAAPQAADSVAAEQDYVSSSTTPRPVSSTLLSSLGPDGVLSITPKALLEDRIRFRKRQFRGRTRYLAPAGGEEGSGAVPAAAIASTAEYSVVRGEESRGRGEVGGAALDRYGPGGWRGFDEVLQGSVDCKRPGLFRHPKYCNKFYACNYDPWRERYTLHVFNCPIHLTYDSSISACNWPVRGPACADDNLLV